MVKPQGLVGCGAAFEDGEAAVSFEIISGDKYYYRSWKTEALARQRYNDGIWHCGEPCPYKDAVPAQKDIVYYCRACQVKVGLVW